MNSNGNGHSVVGQLKNQRFILAGLDVDRKPARLEGRVFLGNQRLTKRVAADIGRSLRLEARDADAAFSHDRTLPFTARHHHLQKDHCEFRCLDDPDGLALRTREGQDFLSLNGIQTQSGTVQCLLGEREALQAAGVQRLRLSPTSQDFAEVLRQFDAVMNHGASSSEAIAAVQALRMPGPLSNGYARPQRPGMVWVNS